MPSPTTVPATWRAQVQDLVAEHAWVLDRGDPRSLADLYTEDGELLGLAEPLIGHEALRSWGEQRAALERISRHVHTNHRLWLGDDGSLRGSLITLLYRVDGPAPSGPPGPPWPVMVLDYDDEYAVDGDRCRFRRRQVTRVFVDRERMPA